MLDAAWRRAWTRARAIEKAWPDPAARLRAIVACRQWLEAQNDQPQLQRLAALATPEMDARQLAALLTPLERANARRRVSDVEVLDGDAPADAPPTGAPMPLTVVADCLRSAFNVGAIFRAAECLGAARLWLCGYTADPTTPQVARAAMGAERLLPWRVWPRADEALEALRGEGALRVALETARDAPTPEDYPWRFPCALLLGNERFGLDAATLRRADGVVRIPMYGRKNSLNVAGAFAICAYAIRRAWETTAAPRTPDAPPRP
jgi:tRNA G18 (ribose-2'-O)-methylase SpoU